MPFTRRRGRVAGLWSLSAPPPYSALGVPTNKEISAEHDSDIKPLHGVARPGGDALAPRSLVIQRRQGERRGNPWAARRREHAVRRCLVSRAGRALPRLDRGRHTRVKIGVI